MKSVLFLSQPSFPVWTVLSLFHYYKQYFEKVVNYYKKKNSTVLLHTYLLIKIFFFLLKTMKFSIFIWNISTPIFLKYVNYIMNSYYALLFCILLLGYHFSSHYNITCFLSRSNNQVKVFSWRHSYYFNHSCMFNSGYDQRVLVFKKLYMTYHFW